MYNSTVQAQILGIYYQEYNFLMGLSGLLIGFIAFYFMMSVFFKD